MNIENTGISPVSGAKPPRKPVKGRSQIAAPQGAPVSGDAAEFSAVSMALSQLAAANDIREDLVSKVLAQLGSGEYLSGDKLKEAVSKLLDQI